MVAYMANINRIIIKNPDAIASGFRSSVKCEKRLNNGVFHDVLLKVDNLDFLNKNIIPFNSS